MSLEASPSALLPTASAPPPNSQPIRRRNSPELNSFAQRLISSRATIVTRLLTITIKVNIAPSCRIAVEQRGDEMKKTKAGRGFWSWIMGRWLAAGGERLNAFRACNNRQRIQRFTKRSPQGGRFCFLGLGSLGALCWCRPRDRVRRRHASPGRAPSCRFARAARGLHEIHRRSARDSSPTAAFATGC